MLRKLICWYYAARLAAVVGRKRNEPTIFPPIGAFRNELLARGVSTYF